MIIFSVFSRLDPFPQDFEQVNGWVMFQLHKIKYPHLVDAQLFLFSFHEQGYQGRVFKVMFFDVWILFPMFLCRLRSP